MLFKKHTAPKEQLDRVAKLYLAYKFFSNLFFAYPIFYQFAQQAITPLQVGIFFSVIGIVGFIAEIPTGVIADKHGRKLSGLAGTATLAAAPLIVFLNFTKRLQLKSVAFLVVAPSQGMVQAFNNGQREDIICAS